MNIIKTLKSSISEKGNYCYSLPVETTKEIIKDVKQLQQENQKYKEVFDKVIEYIKEKYDYILGDDTFLDHDEIIDRKQIIHILELLGDKEVSE